MQILSDYHKINTNKWNDFVSTHPDGNFFQTPDYIEFVSKLKNIESVVLFAINADEILGILCGTLQKEGSGIKAYLSRRLVIEGGPLIKGQDQEIFKLLIKELLKKYSKKSIYVEFRNLFSVDNFKDLLSAKNFKYLAYQNILIDTENETLDGLISSMTYNRRREIRMSLKNDASYCEARNENDVIQLYDILNDLYKSKVNRPLPSLSFFLSIYKLSKGKVFIVLHNNKVIGGSFCFHSPNIYTLYYCGLRSYNKKIFPTHLAVVAAIDYSIKNNLKYVDLMGAGIKNEKYGVREYKKQFGGNLVEFGRYIRINKPIFYFIGKVGIKLLGKFKKL